MIKEIIVILGFIGFAVSQTQGVGQILPIAGAPSPLMSYSDPSFLRAVSAVIKDHPELNGWTPYNATKQIVSGSIFTLYLQSPYDSSTAYAQVFDSIQGTQSVLTFYLWPQRQNPLPYPTIQPIVSGYKTFTDYKNASFQKALAQAKKQDYQLFVNYELTATELYVSDRFYYFRFTLSPRQIFYPPRNKLIQCVAFEIPVIEAPMYTGGGIRPMNISNPGDYHDAYWMMIKSFSYLVRYDIVSVSKQVVAGFNYFFQLEKTYDVYDKISATVSVNTQGRYEVKIIQNDKSIGYSQEVIEQTQLLAQKTWPELQTFTFSIATNINQDFTGLRLTYRNNANVAKYVDLAITNNRETLNLYSY